LATPFHIPSLTFFSSTLQPFLTRQDAPSPWGSPFLSLTFDRTLGHLPWPAGSPVRRRFLQRLVSRSFYFSFFFIDVPAPDRSIRPLVPSSFFRPAVPTSLSSFLLSPPSRSFRDDKDSPGRMKLPPLPFFRESKRQKLNHSPSCLGSFGRARSVTAFPGLYPRHVGEYSAFFPSLVRSPNRGTFVRAISRSSSYDVRARPPTAAAPIYSATVRFREVFRTPPFTSFSALILTPFAHVRFFSSRTNPRSYFPFT